jgi:WD40 repeat protein
MRQNDALAGAEFSPDGKLIATASRDNTAQVWDVQTGTSVSPPLPHARTVSAVAFSPDSRRVATASWDCTARLWDVRTGRALTRPMTHDDHINDIQFSPDGRLLATASRDQTARVWDVATGLPITEPLRHSVAVLRARFHPDGHRLLTTAADSARIWEVPDFSGPTPDWLLPVAEMLSLSGHPGTPQDTVPFIERYHDAEVGKPSTSQDNAYARLARHLFGSKLRSQSN